MKRVWCLLFFVLSIGVFVPVFAADASSDSVTGIYEGFWRTSDGTKGRISAQIRPVGGGKHDGYVAFYKSKVLEGVLKFKPGSGKFEGVSERGKNGMLIPELAGSAEIVNGKLRGSFRGEFGDGSFEGGMTKTKVRRLGAKPPKGAKVLFDGKPAEGAWTDFRWKVTPEGTMVVQGGDIHAKEKFAN